MATARTRHTIDGDRLFYHYLQKDLLENDIWLFQMFTTRLIVALGIWLHPSIYERLPIMLPYAVRDPQSRGDKKKGIPDAWGSPNREGLFRDDNSLIKTIPRSLTIASGQSGLYDGRRLGRGFVAAHVWRELPDGSLASRNVWTYSFVPNLVWLPREVAALTDREGSFVQEYTQALSVKIFREQPLPDGTRQLAEKAWSALPPAPRIPQQGLPALHDLNFFEPTASWHKRRTSAIEAVVAGLDARIEGTVIPAKVISSRYTQGIAELPLQVAEALRQQLKAHLAAAD